MFVGGRDLVCGFKKYRWMGAGNTNGNERSSYFSVGALREKKSSCGFLHFRDRKKKHK
jgi:hypothetical protein